VRTLREKAKAMGLGHVGCADGSCIWGSPGGMTTNGGCGCIKGEKDDLRRLAVKIAHVARALIEDGGR
jgi:hypothetical protein